METCQQIKRLRDRRKKKKELKADLVKLTASQLVYWA
jgi:hypothetical protein